MSVSPKSLLSDYDTMETPMAANTTELTDQAQIGSNGEGTAGVTTTATTVQSNPTDDASPSYALPEKQEFETSTVSFATSLRWLLHKNFKQQCLRRPCAMALKLLCPAFCIIVLGLIKGLLDTSEGYTDFGDDYNQGNEISGNPQGWLSSAVCNYELSIRGAGEGPDLDIQSTRYLAIIANDDTNGHIAAMLDVMGSSWPTNYTDAEITDFIDASDGDCGQYVYQLPFREGWLLRLFDSDEAFDAFLTDKSYGRTPYTPQPNATLDTTKPIGTAISFSVSDDGLSWDYIIRGNSSDMLSVPGTSSAYVDKFTRSGVDALMSNGPSKYEAFIQMQIYIDNSISKYIGQLNGVDLSDVDDVFRGYGVMPVEVPAIDEFWPNLGFFYIFFSMCQFVYPFSQVVSQLIHEKSDKIKEGMQMMGVTTSTYWCSWYLWLFIEATIIAFLCFVMAVPFGIYSYSDPSIIFLWLELFCLNIMCLGTLFSSFFDNPKIAALAAYVVFFALMLLPLFFTDLTSSQKTGMCLLGPSCFHLSTVSMTQYEQYQIGLQWDNIGEEWENFTFATSMLMMFVDSLIYIVLTLYFDKVWPSRYGQRLHPLFFASKAFWSGKKQGDNDLDVMNSPKESFLHRQMSKYEEIASNEQYGDENRLIKVRGLKKHFGSLFDFSKSGQVVKAVDGVSLDMYKGEVFCLLGHNGAGKTTTIGMLTGLLDITDGQAWVDGFSVADSMAEIRKNLGVCPQHDVLFRRLTSREHLEMFARLKGVPEEFIANEVERTLINVGVKEKEDSYPHQMSGGQRRKLSLGIALIGGSKVVFLDEPTSGMDPQSRRVTWNMIAREKKDRCIILTTHFMDEADILGDRIAVMSDGQVKCCGSSLYLKREYGVGYTFVVSLGIDVADALHVKQEIDGIILSTVVGSECVTNAGAEICYRLPFEQTECFPDVFDALDAKKQELNIKAYGISITTLEEVFLKIGQIEHDKQNAAAEDKDEEQKIDMAGNGDIFEQPTFQLETQSECAIYFRHVLAILYQRLKLSYRDIRSLCCQILMPALFACMGLGILELITTADVQPELLMSVDQWYDADEYTMPVGSATNDLNATDINNLFADDVDALQAAWPGPGSFGGNWVDFGFVDQLEPNYENYGGVKVPVGDGTTISGQDFLGNSTRNFMQMLLDEKTPSDGHWHYDALYFPSKLRDTDPDEVVFAYFNASARHSPPIAFNAMSNLILRYKLEAAGVSGIVPNITVSSFPFAQTSTEAAFTGFFGGFMVAMFFMIALGFLPIGAVYSIVNDRANLTKHQQLVSGVSCAAYWTANFVADVLISFVTIFIIWILVRAFDATTFLGDNEGPFVVTLILYALAVMPFTYLLSTFFNSADKAQVVVGAIYFVLGLGLLITSFVVRTVVSDDAMSAAGKASLLDFFRCFPTFLMSDLIMGFAFGSLLGTDDPYKWTDQDGYINTGKDLTYLAIEAVGFFILVLVLEYASLYKTVISKWYNKNDVEVLALVDSIDYDSYDSDVVAEVKRVKQFDPESAKASDSEGDKVVIAGLHKVYKPVIKACNAGVHPVHAVRGVHLGVARGEVFGYLGVNGAGKTTTLACLTGERSMTFGEAYINGISVDRQTETRRFVGYCPQFDALFPLLTGREHLNFYGRIKGLHGAELTKQMEMLIDVLSLGKYASRRAGTYSGGNKRKLSVAIAMIGNPPIVFLDEPSTGMDPMARRSMWDFIRSTMAGRCVVLTTHSMEECEALCHRLCIMTAGQIRCLGTPQHLKSKYGKGYQLDLTLENALSIESDKGEVETALRGLFNATLVEQAQTKLVYEVTLKDGDDVDGAGMTLGAIFRALEGFKITLPIASYALNQTTLEQVFIKMAKET